MKEENLSLNGGNMFKHFHAGVAFLRELWVSVIKLWLGERLDEQRLPSAPGNARDEIIGFPLTFDSAHVVEDEDIDKAA